MCSCSYSPRVRTSMMSTVVPPSTIAFSSSTPMKTTGYSGGAAGAAGPMSTTAATTNARAARTSAPDDAGAAAHGRPPVAELLGLHGLALAAIGDGIEEKVAADGVHVHQIVPAVGGDAAVAVETAELAVANLVDRASGDAKVLPALRDRRRAVPAHVVPVFDLGHEVPRIAISHAEHRIGHADQRNEGGIGGLVVTVGGASEDRRRLPAVHEAGEDTAIDVHDAASRRALMVVAIVAIAGQAGVGVRGDQRGGDGLAELVLVQAAQQP